jgi:hypothetical protein
MHLGKSKHLRCRLGWHKKVPVTTVAAERIFLLTGVNLMRCAYCDWRMKGA